ncbi:alpha-1,4-glucan--maltose-1-phosphate maltosyltransferase [Galbitalea sp. SE-J8]|uniref:alpha-1,4-glucan--maltose-1-phosphate maltosyltransferase n=1 Tax=Galbitalea sp. SE-J8 TaxID=3054952 RepID=UPI00259C7FBA|nr:alpha-1,4-glucan--maltose-1-phosphate maltosyltransferase [Galbitalea sp. SE-J8]MDM4764339.1 alpha-1,4-glucan--maltose-1-phosphate maltosyltransferase [Galbitalea sp. SE-J8]
MVTSSASNDAAVSPAFRPAIGRIPIRDLSPRVSEDRWPTKAYAGEVIPVEATVFREGHDLVGGEVVLRAPDGSETATPLEPVPDAPDRWRALVQVTSEGDWSYRIRAYSDDWATWLHVAEVKIPAGLDVELTFAMGAELLERSARGGRSRVLTDAAAALRDDSRMSSARLQVADDPRVLQALAKRPARSLVTESESVGIRVERQRAGYGAWYEFFPRSEGAKQRRDGSWQSGTFRTAAKRLPAVAAMGFDVLYLPPIHPIGEAFRKGRNNTLDPRPGDPGSPWAIGSAAGGHDAVHPDLGTLADFRFFVREAGKVGLEVALDLALQASPDHPWVRSHPEFFTARPDGSIAYAENPPKKYQDIYPINFDRDPVGLRAEVLRIVRHWIAQGVRIFRVDNPHTKPLAFWEWLIATVNAVSPDVVFLAEAFTRPAMMQSLAAAGFQQSYTYFTWRNTKEELQDYLTEVSHETSGWFRPNFFVNTPDILTEYLQFGGVPAYKVRAAIAATASPSWGVYAGYELVENVARPGSEENLDNEKYEYKSRDWARHEAEGRSLAPYLTRLNEIRRAHPALHQLRNLDVHWSDDDAVLVYSKFLPARFAASGRSDGIVVVANLDPHSVRETRVHLDPRRFGLPSDAPIDVTELVTGQRWRWQASGNFVHLDAFVEPVHILSIDYPKGM